MTSKPSFFKKATSIAKYLIPLFLFAHILLGVLVLVSAPIPLIVVLSVFVLLFYLLIGVAGLAHILRLGQLATKDFIKHGLDKDSREALVIIVVMGFIAVIFMKLWG